jgi:hypothetical protein
MDQMSKVSILTDTHIGKDVPDELAVPALLKRLVDNSRRTSKGCLEWTGWRVATGYGMTAFRGRSRPTHRLMYLVTKGPIPPGMQVLHKCDNPPCLNPQHLEIGTGQENMRQSVQRGRHYEAVKTHCDQGHELSGDQVHVEKNGRRHCKVCSRIRHRINAGWPEDLAKSTPKGYTGKVPSGLKRIKPPARRPHGAPNCSKGHALSGKNRYVTPKGNVECRKCRQIARTRYGERRKHTFSGGTVKNG